MKPLKVLGVYRLPMFSNNAIEADRLILEDSIAQIQSRCTRPVDVEMVEESSISNARGNYDLVLTMGQSEQALNTLERMFDSDIVWNSPQAIRNCYRKAMSNALAALPVGYVPFQILPTDGTVTPKMSAGEHYWLKRSDFHAISDEDVSFAETSHEAQEKLRAFRGRGVQEVILQKHIHGDIYKFYGVKGKFFRAIRVRDFLKSQAVPNYSALESVVQVAAEALGLQIYGGDCILDAAGKFHLIDLNDWPSFRICRSDAAAAIGTLAADHLNNRSSKSAKHL